MMSRVIATDLRAVIRRIEGARATAVPAPSFRPSPSLEELVQGQVEETPRGPILVTTRQFPANHAHGRIPVGLVLGTPPYALAVAGGLHTSRAGEDPVGGYDGALRPNRLLYLDTETTGLAGGTGTYVFMVGVGFFDGGQFVTRQYFMRDLSEEPALLSVLASRLSSFDAIVTFNGRAFDVPLLETRFIMARQRWPALRHLDLLPAARRLWSNVAADCRLSTLEETVLGVTREGDVPGSLIPRLYLDYLRRKDPASVVGIFAHNLTDLLSLAALTGWTARALSDPEGLDLSAEEYMGLGRLWELADRDRALACYRISLERGLRGDLRGRLLLRLASQHKSRAQWDQARQLWEVCIEQGGFDVRPWEELAKYSEHRVRDFATARQIVEAALARAEAAGAADFLLDDLRHRLYRLECRQAGRRWY